MNLHTGILTQILPQSICERNSVVLTNLSFLILATPLEAYAHNLERLTLSSDI